MLLRELKSWAFALYPSRSAVEEENWNIRPAFVISDFRQDRLQPSTTRSESERLDSE